MEIQWDWMGFIGPDGMESNRIESNRMESDGMESNGIEEWRKI